MTTTATAARLAEFLSDVTYKDGFVFTIGHDDSRHYLQVLWDGVDAISGLPRTCRGRKWWLSEHMTKSEVIQTALAAVLMIEEHEAREMFRYQGHPIFGPHYNVDHLVGLCDYGPGALALRE